jgi:hypothetical protein
MLAIGGSVAARREVGRRARLGGHTWGAREQVLAAWKSGDGVFWTTFLSDKFVGWGPPGRLDKDGAMRALSGADCRIDSYRLQFLLRLLPLAGVGCGATKEGMRRSDD